MKFLLALNQIPWPYKSRFPPELHGTSWKTTWYISTTTTGTFTRVVLDKKRVTVCSVKNKSVARWKSSFRTTWWGLKEVLWAQWTVWGPMVFLTRNHYKLKKCGPVLLTHLRPLSYSREWSRRVSALPFSSPVSKNVFMLFIWVRHSHPVSCM